jgi:hypothetical protein
MRYITPEELEQKKIESICRETLRDKATYIIFSDIEIKERLTAQVEFPTSIHYNCKIQSLDKDFSVDAAGDGLFDALFMSMKKNMSEDYQTLADIEVAYFKAEALIESTRAHTSNSDATVLVEVGIYNNRKELIVFKSLNRSLISATISTVKKIFEFMIDVERAAVTLKRAIDSGLASEKFVESAHSKLADLVRFSSLVEAFK